MSEVPREGLWREGDYWTVRDGGRDVRLRHSKGLAYLAQLLEHPAQELHVLQLVAAEQGTSSRSGVTMLDSPAADDAAGAGAALDQQAKAAYRERIDELREEVEQAREWRDDERAARAEEELEIIMRELAGAVGLSGRDRPSFSQAERARQNVGRAIRKAVAHMGEVNPRLGAHLARTVRTGAFCEYRPEPEPPFPVLTEAPPASSPPAATRSNFTLQLTSFIGRERERSELAALLGQGRLVTLTGPGGAGKTRLAVEVADELLDRFTGGVWLVELAPISDPDLVVKAIGQALSVSEHPSRSLLDDLRDRLASSETLIVLDNCEHLLDACAEVGAHLLRAAPGLRILATSRERLGVPGEVIFHTGSLADDAAAQLFAERAAAVVPGFRLTSEVDCVVAGICRRLDAMPLAIELAAARVDSLSLPDIASNLDDRFSLLTGGARTSELRQRTLMATIAWSYELLSDREAGLFDALSVFAGGWTLESARHVGDHAGLDPGHVLGDLIALTEKSMVVREGARFRMLETLREYGRSRLAESEGLARVRDAHLAWAVSFVGDAEIHIEGPDQAEWLGAVDGELDNLRAGLEWALASGKIEGAFRLVCFGMGGYWLWRSHLAEAQRWLDRLLNTTEPVTLQVEAHALLVGARFDHNAGEWDRGARRAARSAELFQAATDVANEAWALVWRVFNMWGQRPTDDVEEAVAAALAAARRADVALPLALALGSAGVWSATRGDLERAHHLIEDAAQYAEHVPGPNWLAHFDEGRAIIAYLRGEADRARQLLSEALGLYLEIDNVSCLAHCLEAIAAIATAEGADERGAELLGVADEIRARSEAATPAYERALLEMLRSRVGELPHDDDTVATARERGRHLPLQDAIDRAREALC